MNANRHSVNGSDARKTPSSFGVKLGEIMGDFSCDGFCQRRQL